MYITDDDLEKQLLSGGTVKDKCEDTSASTSPSSPADDEKLDSCNKKVFMFTVILLLCFILSFASWISGFLYGVGRVNKDAISMAVLSSDFYDADGGVLGVAFSQAQDDGGPI